MRRKCTEKLGSGRHDDTSSVYARCPRRRAEVSSSDIVCRPTTGGSIPSRGRGASCTRSHSITDVAMWYGEITMTTRTQAEKGEAFRALHERAGGFIIPNPWDVGTACLLEHLGFEALATTSAGYAFSVGRPDSAVGR